MAERTSLKLGDKLNIEVRGEKKIGTVAGKEVHDDGDFVRVKIDDNPRQEFFLLMVEEAGRLRVIKAVDCEESP